jgi:hypothetical protein
MKKTHLMLFAACALLSATAVIAAPQAVSTAPAIDDRELFAAATLTASLADQQALGSDDLALVENAWQTAVGSMQSLQLSATLGAMKAGKAGEGPEGVDTDGPGGSTHEFQGEENGEH